MAETGVKGGKEKEKQGCGKGPRGMVFDGSGKFGE